MAQMKVRLIGVVAAGTLLAATAGSSRAAPASRPITPSPWDEVKSLTGYVSVTLSAAKDRDSVTDMFKATIQDSLQGNGDLTVSGSGEEFNARGNLPGSLSVHRFLEHVMKPNANSKGLSVRESLEGTDPKALVGVIIVIQPKKGTYRLIVGAPPLKDCKYEYNFSGPTTSHHQEASSCGWSAFGGGQTALQPLPAAGGVFTGRTNFQSLSWNISREGGVITEVLGMLKIDARGDTKVEWRFSPKGYKPPESGPVVDGPSCACGETGKVTLGAHAEGGGTFEPFEVQSNGQPAEQVENQGGQTPKLVLSGIAKATGKTTVVAVYTKDGKTTRSSPFAVSFCQVEKPEPVGRKVLHGFHDDYVFDEGDPGRVEIEAEGQAWLNGVDASEKLRWELSPNAGDFLRPKEAKTAHQTWSAETLPPHNTDFGKKKGRSEIREEGCSCKSEPFEVRLFYPAFATNNPEGRNRNWAYYYPQTKARQGLVYTLIEDIPDQQPCAGGLLTVFATDVGMTIPGHYDFCRDIIFLSSRLNNEVKCPGREQRNVDKDTGIDCYAVTLRHEHQHQVELTGFWGVNMSRYDRSQDPDADLIPSSFETSNDPRAKGCRPDNDKSCDGRPAWAKDELTDLEFDAYQVGWSWQRGQDDEEDWAVPGKNWTGPLP
jgi:hypothetical protein